MRGGRIQIPLLAAINGPHAFRWRADDGPTFNAGLVVCDFKGILTSVAKEPYIFVIFKGGGGPDPLPPPLWIRTCTSDKALQNQQNEWALCDDSDQHGYRPSLLKVFARAQSVTKDIHFLHAESAD